LPGRLIKTEKPNTVEDTESDAPSRGSPEAPDVEDTEEIPPVRELQWANDIFDAMGEERPTLMFTQHGNKSRIVKNIVHEAVKLKDNVLIFVHSIPTLNFLNSVLKHRKHRIYILTGETLMKNRQEDIDRFNKETGAVYLISSRVSLLFAGG
jgi:SNF2 family DNA or RNA helicase